ncbi:MAG: hypothetical protein KY476_23620 [Planctomycetes bacterium]|nr:hypothetical protein [Planctomycetota bacterium]
MGSAALAVLRFEWNRTLTAPRMAWWLALVLFPPAITILVRANPPTLNAEYIWWSLLYFLIPGVVCLMGLLLWATPAIQSELENKTWIYLAVRPGGKVAVLLGKYLTAVTWTVPAGWLGLILSVILAGAPNELGDWLVLGALVLLSCMTYAAVFLFIGTIFQKRPMVVALIYTIVVEFVLGIIPAMINQFTVQHHLRSIGVRWLGWDEELPLQARAMYLGEAPAILHVIVLLAAAGFLLAVSAIVLRERELIVSEED